MKNTEKEDRINIPIPYNPRLPDYGYIIKQNWNYMVQKNPELKKVMPAPPRVCFRRPKNLRDMLVRAKLPPLAMVSNVKTKQGFRRCMNSRCQVCPYTVNTPTHTSLHRKKTWNIQNTVDCITSHCVYSVTCHKVGGPAAAGGRVIASILASPEGQK